MTYRRDNQSDESIPLPLETKIDLAIDDFFEYLDLDSIQCVDDLMNQFNTFLHDIGFDRIFHPTNINIYHNIDDINRLIASYVTDDDMYKKIDLLYKCIELTLLHEQIEPLIEEWYLFSLKWVLPLTIINMK